MQNKKDQIKSTNVEIRMKGFKEKKDVNDFINIIDDKI